MKQITKIETWQNSEKKAKKKKNQEVVLVRFGKNFLQINNVLRIFLNFAKKLFLSPCIENEEKIFMVK
jgi:hypothetical protein